MSQNFINAVRQVVSGDQECLYIVNLDEVDDTTLQSFREQIRSAFAEDGVEVEFSGKGTNERGVVIDIDEQRFQELQLDLNTLRFGQTVVRVRV